MGRLIKSQDYLMKCFGFVLLLGFISLGAIGGCNNNGGNNDNTQALTENDFAADSSVFARPNRGVVVHFLEPPGGDTPESDTGEVGIDIIPFRYNQTFEHTICWEDDDTEAAHFMTLVDQSGEEVLMVEVNGDCKTEVIEKGNYEMRVHHDGMSEETHPIFIQPLIEDQLAGNTASEHGTIKTVKRIFEETFRNIEIITEARAQVDEKNINTLIKTRACVKCNLQSADLKGRNLAGVDLSEACLVVADLREADLTSAVLTKAEMIQTRAEAATFNGADLSNANLNGANLNGANLNENGQNTPANLSNASLIETSLVQAGLNNANLRNADLHKAELCSADMQNADLTNANVSKANLAEAKLNGAIMKGANLSEATLDNANLDSANLTTNESIRVDLSNASLFGTILTKADLTGANLTNADLEGANMIQINLTDADLTGANLTAIENFEAIFDGALWCDGSCTCGSNSIGFCAGCSSPDTCTGN